MNAATIWECTAEEYRHTPGVIHQSDLCSFISDPEQYYDRKTGRIPPRERTEYFDYGCRFERYVMYDELPIEIPREVLKEDKNGKLSRSGKAWEQYRDEQIIQHGPDVELLLPSQYEATVTPLKIAKEKLWEHDMARRLLFGNTQKHLRLKWTDEDTGLECACELDFLNLGSDDTPLAITDLKSGRSSKPHAFNRHIGDYGYHIQAWWYREAVRRWCGLTLPWAWVISKSSSAWTCEVIEPSDEWFRRARASVKIGMRMLVEATETGDFHSQTHGEAVKVSPPNYTLVFDL